MASFVLGACIYLTTIFNIYGSCVFSLDIKEAHGYFNGIFSLHVLGKEDINF